ncbi:MAG: hypothetical protein GX224_05830 [Thermoplasmatales archaeon]|nr:hypothetical protein [Thermoplasmatales archaeon]
MSGKIVVMGGDGIGPEVVSATVRVLECLNDGLEFIHADVGMHSFEKTGEYLPGETLSAIEGADAILAGCVIDPEPTKGYRNPFDEIKKRLGLFADVREVGRVVPKKANKKVSMTVVSENPLVESTISEIESVDGVVLERRTNYELCRRLTGFATSLAARDGHRNVTCVHHASAYKVSDSMFRDTFMETMVGAGIDHGEIEVDRATYEIIANPGRFDVIVTLSPYGNLLLAEASALAGGMHYVPSASLGAEKGFFEPMHGAVPALAGKDVANPTASMLSGAMLLRHLGLGKDADALVDSLNETVRLGLCTPDAGGITGTMDLADRVCEIIGKGCRSSSS